MPIGPQQRIEREASADEPARMTPLRELQLLEAHRRGDPQAVGELLGAYQRRLYAICYRMVRHEQDARDLTQDAMVKVLEGLDTYDGRSKLSTWIIRVTMNCCLSHLRKQRLRRHGSIEGDWPRGLSGPSGPDPGVGELSPFRSVEQTEMHDILSRALHCLDPDMRAALVLRDMQGLEYHQIAEVLDIPLGTVKSRLFRARVALRNAVEVETGRGTAGDEPKSG
jgi:RNA polymerase sigma-70 factor (ECF subfamily)